MPTSSDSRLSSGKRRPGSTNPTVTSREPVERHPLVDWSGAEVDIADLLSEKDDLVVTHYMGKRCPYCTLWADAFDCVIQHTEDRTDFAVVSPDDPDTQHEFAAERGYTIRLK